MQGKFLVEIGRVALITSGPDAGKIAAIVDFIDQNRVLIDGPSSGVVRRAESFKNLQLTRFVLKFPHGCNSNFIKKQWDEANINSKFLETPKAKQLAAKARVSIRYLSYLLISRIYDEPKTRKCRRNDQ